MDINDLKNELQEWIFAEKRAGRSVDMNRLNERLQVMMQRRNCTPCSDFNGLTPEQMHNIMYFPFSEKCVVTLNMLNHIGNLGMAYSVWLLNKYGDEWHTGEFYQEHYQKVFDFPDFYNTYATRVFQRLFYWLGIDEERLNSQVGPPFRHEYKKTELLSAVFSFKDK